MRTPILPGQRACRILFGKMRNVCYWFSEVIDQDKVDLPTKEKKEFLDQIQQLKATNKVLFEHSHANRNYDVFREKVRKAYTGSDFEGFWTEAVKGMKCDFNDHVQDMYLTAPDIKTIEEGKMGMRKWSKWEDMLIEASKERIAEVEERIAEGAYNFALVFETQATRMLEEAKTSPNSALYEKGLAV